MKKLLSVFILTAAVLGAQAKSLVVTLADGTQVYYLMDGNPGPRMVMNADGTFVLNGEAYAFFDVKSFRISTTDYAGEEGTKQGASDIIVIENDQAVMQGSVSVYTLDGRLVAKGTDGADLRALPADTYVISNGEQTLKFQKK